MEDQKKRTLDALERRFAQAAADVHNQQEHIKKRPRQDKDNVYHKVTNPSNPVVATATPSKTACKTCKKTLDILMERVIKCSGCDEQSGVELRSRVPLQLTEGESNLFVTIKSSDIELLTNITPQHLRESHEFGLNVEEELKIELEKLMVVCFLKRKQNKMQESQDIPVIRYAALKTYNVAELKKSVVPHCPLKKPDVEGGDPSEKKFFTPTAAKLLKEIEDQQLVAEISRLSTSAKRNIDFVSMTANSDGEKAIPADTSKVSANVQAFPSAVDYEQSPVKKNKEHLKQN